MTQFTPWSALAGGLLIGLSAVLMMAVEGRIAGISGIAARLLPPYRDGAWKSNLAFVAGLVVGPFVATALGIASLHQSVSPDLGLMAAAGLLVGFGAAYGSGCTSGHGVCGLARLSGRSFAATATFMATAFVTVFVVRHLL